MGSAVDKLLGKTSATSTSSAAPVVKQGAAVAALLAKAKSPLPSPVDRQQVQITKPQGVTTGSVLREAPGAAVKVGKGIVDFFTKNTQNLVKTAVENLGSSAAYHLVPEVKKAVDDGRYVLPPMKESQSAGLKKIAGQAIGSAAELASFAKGAQVAAGATKTGLGQVAKQGAVSGAKYGTAFGVGQGLQDNKSAGQVALEGVKGGATGAVAGALLSTVIGGIAQKAKGMKAKPVTTEIGKDTGAYVGGVTVPTKAISTGTKNARKEIIASTTLSRQYAEFPKEQLFQPNGKMQPQFAQGRIDDVAQKLDDMYPGKGLGQKLRENVDVNNIGLDDLQKGAIALAENPKIVTNTLANTSRANQSIIPDVQRKIESDPKYTARLAELGGGKVKSNPETLQAGLRQVNEGRVTVDTIASHQANTPVNEDTVAAAAIIKDHYEQKWIEAMNKGDANGADEANTVLQKIAPGYKNITATPGRATQIQSQFGEDKMTGLYKRMRELQEKKVPFKAVQKELDTAIKTLRKDEAAGKIKGRAVDTLRALENYATGAKLTSPITHLVNTVSNALTFVERGAERYAKAGVQLAQGKPQEAAATAKYAFGTGMGLRSGLRKFATMLTEDAPEYGLKAEMTGAAKVSKTPKALRVANPFRWLSAADGFWKAIIQDGELHTKAYAAAKADGLTGKALSEKITQLVNNAPSQWSDDAAKVAQEYTFQMEPDKFLKAVSKMRNIPGGRLVIPFIQTPYNIVKFQAQRSALGLLSRRNIGDIAKGGDAAAEGIARLAVGTGLSMGAWQLAQHGQVTGMYPTDVGERAVWESEGRKPYSIKIGNKWFAYNRFQPVGLYLTQAAALDSAVKAGDKEGAGAVFSKMIAYTGKAINDLPFVSGMAGIINAIEDPEHYAEKALSSTVTGFIPNVLRDVRQQVDSTQREAKGVVQSAKNMVPGLSQKLQPKIDVFGRTKQYDADRLARASKVLSTIRETPETKLLRDTGYPVAELGTASRTLSMTKGKTKSQYKLSDSEFTQYKIDAGEAVLSAIKDIKKTPGWNEMDTDKKASILSKKIGDKKEAVRENWKKKLAGKFVQKKP